MRVHRKHLTGHHNPNQLDLSVNYGWLFISWLHPVESMSTYRPCPDFKSEWPQKKEWSVNSFGRCGFFRWCSFIFVMSVFRMSFFRASFHLFGVCDDINFWNVQLDGVHDGDERKHPKNNNSLLSVMGNHLLHLFGVCDDFNFWNLQLDGVHDGAKQKTPRNTNCIYP